MNERPIITTCCSPLVNENDRIQKLKPMILISLFTLIIIIFLDYFLFETVIYIYLSLIVLPIFLMAVKRFYFFFTLYSFFFIFIAIPKMLNDLGTYFQVEVITTMRIIVFIMKLFCFIILIMIYYVFFLYYKELKYLFLKQRNDLHKQILDTNAGTGNFDINMNDEEQDKNEIKI